MKLKREEQVNKYRGSLDSFVKKKSLNLGKSINLIYFFFMFIKFNLMPTHFIRLYRN